MLINLLFLAFFCASSNLHPESKNIYHHIAPLLTKKINPEQPSEADQSLLNGAAAFIQAGTNQQAITPETIQAISSVDFFSDILPQYFHTQTTSGLIQSAHIVATMTDDLTTLQRRQQIIQFLHNNPDILKNIKTTLQAAKTGEQRLFAQFKPISAEKQFEHQMEQYQTSFTSEMFKKWNNKYILGGFKRLKQLNCTQCILITTIYCSSVTQLYYAGIPFSQACSITTAWMKQIPQNIINAWNNGSTGDKAQMAFMGAYFAGIEGLTIYDIKKDFDVIHDQQKKLIEIAQLLHSMKKISKLIKQHEELHPVLMPAAEKIKELFNPNASNTSADLKHFINTMLSSSFQGEPSYWFSKQGTILEAHYYLNLIKNELIQYTEALGVIDAYISAAQLYSTFKQHPYVRFCLPTFVESKTPILNIEKYWHPLIDPNVVVTNDLTMGNNIKNLMITGPNAGGKTTSLMSLIINIIFAQSFGIAPSASLSMTPFAKIHSYLDITTNLQEGLSLFAAEVDRAKKLKQSINSCTYGQKTFTIIDEIFSGTNPTVASDIGFKFAAQLGEIPHSMTIITTHFPRLTDIEKECKTFTNYKVADATIIPSGKIIYPFKLIPGISSQNVAQHMLEQADII